MKGDSNNFNEISESIIEENVEKFPEDDEDSIKMNNYTQLQRNQMTVQKSNHFYDQSRISPSKSSKIPNSIAFKRSSNDQSLNENNQIISGRGEPIQTTRQRGVKKEKIRINKGDKKTFNNFIDSEDDAITQRTNQPLTNMFLVGIDKFEQHKRIHLRNGKDFTNVYDSRGKLLLKGVDLFIYILSLLRMFLNLDHLIQIMTLSREFREEFNKNPTSRQKRIYKLYKNQLRFIIINGFPTTIQRIKYWNFKTKFCFGNKRKPNQFERLKKQKLDESEAIDILKDVSRTFPDMTYFQKPQKGQQELFDILNAVAKKKTHTGYIQGMNFLAGMILINLQRGEETFYMMMSILNTHEFDKILDLESGGRFQVLCYQLETFLLEYMPHLASHFKKLKIPTDIYAANWFITMFCCELSMDLVFSILDIFLLEGIKSLLRVSLALLSYLHDRLLKMNDEECMNFLSSRNKDVQMDSQTLLENAYQFKITDSLLQDLELFYKLKNKKKNPIQQIFKAFNRLSLQEEEVKFKDQPPKKRQYWIVQAATPDDLKELLKNSKNITLEDIDYFYQRNIKNRKLREIVEELQTEEDSKIANVNNYAFEKKDIQNAKMLQPSHRKKETQHSKYTQSALNQNKKKSTGTMLHFSNDSNNTIKEMTNDFSKGGLSGGKKNQNNSSYATSNFSNGDTSKLISTSEQRNLHLSVVMGGSDERLVTPRRLQKINNDLSTKNKKTSQPNQLSIIKKESESPFIQQIGTKIKSYLFGNFFKTQEKLNKSYEENEQLKNYIPFSRQDQRTMNLQPSFENDLQKKQNRSKSIHQSVLSPNNHRDSPEIRVTTTQTYQSNQNYSKSPYISLGQNNNYHSLANHLPSKEHKIHVTTEENHNIPNNQSSIFNTTTHLQQVSKIEAIQMNNEYFINDNRMMMISSGVHNLMGSKPSPHNQMLQHRIKQISKSLERGQSEEVDSAIYGDEDDDCEIELLSQSADCTIQTVEENIHFKKNQEFKGAAKRPEILIEKDIIAGDDEILESQNYSNIDIQFSKVNKNLPLFNINGNQLSQTLKVSNNSQSSSQALINFKKQQQLQNYNSNPRRESSSIKEVFNIKTMRSSPPVSPKDRQQQKQSALPGQRGGHTVKTATITINKKVK